MPRLLRAVLQRTAWAGRGPHPAPRLALSFQKTGENFREEALRQKSIYFATNLFEKAA